MKINLNLSLLTAACLFLFWTSCKPDDSPSDSGSKPLLVLHLDMGSIAVNPDLDFAVSISDMDGNVIDTKPVDNDTIKLGENFASQNSPQKLVLHVFYLYTSSNSNDNEIAIFSYADIIPESEFSFKPHAASQFYWKNAALILDAEGKSLNTFPSFSSFISTGEGVGYLTQIDQTTYQSKPYFGDSLLTEALTIVKTNNNPNHYYWKLIPFSIGDTTRIGLSDMDLINSPTHTLQAPGTSYASISCYFSGKSGGKLFQFDSRSWSGSASFNYTVPGLNFTEYHTSFQLQSSDGTLRTINKRGTSPETAIPSPAVDIQYLGGLSPRSFSYSTSGPVSHTQVNWFMDSTSTTGENYYFTWVFAGPPSLSTQQIQLPVLHGDWLPEVDWMESRKFSSGSYVARSLENNPTYNEWVQSRLDLDKRQQLMLDIQEQVVYRNR